MTSIVTTGGWSTPIAIGRLLDMTEHQSRVAELLKSLETGDTKPFAHIDADKFVQHMVTVADGLAGFRSFFRLVPKGKTKSRTLPLFPHGPFLFPHREY